MGRLTIKNRDFWDVEHAQLKDGIPSKWTHSQRIDPLEQALLKLAKFEDFMEDNEIDSIEELCYCIETREKMLEVNGELNQQIKRKQKENQALKDRWAELKEFVQKDHDWNLEQDNNDCALAERWVLEEMQKLEKEN